MKTLPLAIVLVTGVGTPILDRSPDPLPRPMVRRSTFSIVAHDPERKEWGVATASKVLAVGAGTPWARAHGRAIATQAEADVTYGPRGLKLLARGKSAAEVLARLTKNDKDRQARQVGIVDRQGRPAAFTGKECDPWCGARMGKHHVCLGNLLQGEEVVAAMSAAFEKGKGPLAWRMMTALEAGQAAGGDKRGKQSAAILVVRHNGGYLGLDDRAIDFRVDDHKEPIAELARILALELARPQK